MVNPSACIVMKGSGGGGGDPWYMYGGIWFMKAGCEVGWKGPRYGGGWWGYVCISTFKSGI